MNDVQEPIFTDRAAMVETGKKEYGTRENRDMPPTESEQRGKHSKEHQGKFHECKQCERDLGVQDDSRKNAFVPDTGGTSASMGTVGRTTLSRSQMETMGKREIGNVPSTIVELDNGDQYVLDNETDMWIFSKPGERRNSTDELPSYPGLFPTL